MVLQHLQISHPVGIDGKIGLKRTADPWAVVFFALGCVGVNRIVHEHQADAALRELIDLFPALADHAGAIGIDHQCFDPVQNGLVLRPSGNDGRLDAETAVVETFGEQLTSGIELVLAGSVTAATGKENNLVRRLCAEGAGKGSPNREKQGFCILYHGGST